MKMTIFKSKNVFGLSPAIIILLAVVLLAQCSNLTTDITPDSVAKYHSLRIKVNAKNLTNNQRQSFKVLLKYNQDGDKMLFLSPLNQVYGVLVVKKEIALMVNTKKRKYWQGPFKRLLQFMWGRDMDFQYTQFKALMVKGTIPRSSARQRNLNITILPSGKGSPPQRLEISNPDILVTVKISNRKTSTGRLSLKTDTAGMKEAIIRDLFE